jgi:protein phosphatase 1B
LGLSRKRGKIEMKEGTEIQPSLEDVIKGVKTGFLKLDEVMRSMPEMASGEDKSGSTKIPKCSRNSQ